MIKLNVNDKELKITDAIKGYVEEKLERIEKYYPNELINVDFKTKDEKTTQIAELYLNISGQKYKAVSEEKDLYASIDRDIDILEGQIRKTKTKKDKLQRETSIKQINFDGNEEYEVENEVVKYLHYDIKPMSIEDAKLRISEKPGDTFFTFINVDTGKVNVLYKILDGKNYGLVEPEE